jgi:hypothetical protein
MKVCHRCGHELHPVSAIQRTDSCPHCRSDLKCCLNCRLHDPGANNQCREPQAEWVAEKDKANFCEFFEFRETSALSHPGRGGARADARNARAAFDALFGRKRG